MGGPEPLALLEAADAQTSDQALRDFVFASPILLKPEFCDGLDAALAAAPVDEARRQRLADLVKLLRRNGEAVLADPGRYVLGPGPLETLARRAASGEISIETAQSLAAAPAVTAALSPPYLTRLSQWCRGEAQAGRWRRAMPQQRILLAAAAALPPPAAGAAAERNKILNRLDLDWIDIVHGALMDVWDGRWLTSALDAGERVRARAGTPPDDALAGELSFRLGVMYLDAYSAGFTSINYQGQVSQKRWRLRDELGQQAGWIAPEELKMPEPVAALGEAVVHLTDAVTRAAPEKRPLAVKALDQAIQWTRIAGGTPDPAAVALAARQKAAALAGIDRETDPEVWVAMFAQLAAEDAALDAAPLLELLKTPLDDFVQRLSGRRALALASQAAQALAHIDPARALDLFRLAAPLLPRFGDSKMRSNWHELELNVIQRGIAAPLLKLPGGGVSVPDVAAGLRAAMAAEGWGATRLAASLMLMAGVSGNTAEELAGLALLDEAAALAPVFAENHAGAVGRLRASLWLGEGKNGYARRDWPAAVAGYGRSLALYLQLRDDGNAGEALRLLRDVAGGADTPVDEAVAAALMPVALRIEAQLGDAGRGLVVGACRDAAAAAVTARRPAEIISLLWQMAKGLRFSAALTRGIARRAVREGGVEDGADDADREGAALLAQIAAFPAALRIGGAALDIALNETVLLSPYASRPAAGGEDDAVRLANLQQQFDAWVTGRLMAGPVLDDPPYAEIAAIQASLDERTVLLIYFMRTNAAGQPAIHMLALTRAARRVAGVDWAGQPVLRGLAVDGFVLDTGMVAGTVRAIREAIQAYGGPDEPLSAQAARLLDDGLSGFLGNLPAYLAAQRGAGKDHLCIVPHGALHFLPFHALRENGKPLAESWIVTYLPNMGLLFGYRGGAMIPPARAAEMTSIGLSFQTHNPFSLPPIPRSESEARAVAALFGADPVLDEAATEAVVMRALQHSRYVHLSTHGVHNTAAPSFQNLFFTPGETADGMLHAFEILALDLRGIEILTLSACETALGRFDEGDNLRGLPASFLLAGASTLIGTLWEVDPDASEAFFVAFYTAVKSGADRRDAFQAAQARTRAAYPRYAHWAAFYFIGSWK